MWKIFKNPFRICRTSFQNPFKILPKSAKSLQKSRKCVLGACSAPNRDKVGSRTPQLSSLLLIYALVWPKMVFQGLLLGSLGRRKSGPKRIFEDRRALERSKNGIKKGGLKKREHLTKNRCGNGRFLMARNHVWRYTLRLFHTFAIFEKYRKMEPKMEAESYVFSSKSMFVALLFGPIFRLFFENGESVK